MLIGRGGIGRRKEWKTNGEDNMKLKEGDEHRMIGMAKAYFEGRKPSLSNVKDFVWLMNLSFMSISEDERGRIVDKIYEQLKKDRDKTEIEAETAMVEDGQERTCCVCGGRYHVTSSTGLFTYDLCIECSNVYGGRMGVLYRMHSLWQQEMRKFHHDMEEAKADWRKFVESVP